MIGDKKGSEVNIPVICINDKDKPAEIPHGKWVKKGERYTIVEFCRMNQLGGKMGVRIAEIDLTDCFPYQFFLADRFGLLVEQSLEEMLEGILEEAKEEFEKVENIDC